MTGAPPERLSFALYKIEQRALHWLHDVTRGRVFLIPPQCERVACPNTGGRVACPTARPCSDPWSMSP
jgi:hypothetical protein